MNYKHFTVEEGERIQEMLWQKSSIRTIATALGRSPSSVSREINKNKDSLVEVFSEELNYLNVNDTSFNMSFNVPGVAVVS